MTHLAVQEGDRVKRGDFLMQIDPRNLRSAVARAQATLAASASQAQQLRVAVESARVTVAQAQAAFRRQNELAALGLTTKETLERSGQELKMREADLRSQEQQVRTQSFRMDQDKATLDSARLDLSKVRIESPIDGVVTRRNIEEGETVVVGTMNNAGTVLLTIADLSIIEAEVEVDETDLPSVRLGQAAIITIDALPGRTFTAHGHRAWQQSDSECRYRVWATNFKEVLTVEGSIPNVRPGFTCTAEITTASRDGATAVPIQATTVREMSIDASGAIVRGGAATATGGSGRISAGELPAGQGRKELEGVFVLRDMRAVFTPITTGIAGERYFEVLAGVSAETGS